MAYGTLAAVTVVAGQTMAILDGSVWFPLAFTAVAATALCVGFCLLVEVRFGGERVYSPGWYRKFQQAARARAAGSSR